MDTIGLKTPVPLTLADWAALPPDAAARLVRARVAALPAGLRRAAVAWLRPEAELAADLAAAPAGPCRGAPYFLKDLFDFAGAPTGAGSRFLAQVRPAGPTAEIVRRLGGAGAALAGKAHLVEFASGLTGENPHFGDCPHPGHPDRLTGGSSSGSAALVAAGVVPFAVGTDTGGSVRVPAAFCGLYGFRLTPGDALVRDAFPLSPTMDTAGILAGSAADLLTLWRVLAAPAPGSTRKPRGVYLPGRRLLPAIDPAVEAACARAAAAWAEPADAALSDTLAAEWTDAVDAYIAIGMTEAHAVHRDWLAPHRDAYDPVIWQRFTDAGTWPTERATAARAVQARIRAAWARFFAEYDFLVLPAAPTPAPRKADCTPDLRRGILTLTAPASLGGLPCLSVPVPLSDGLSTGLQVIFAAPASPVVEEVLGKQGAES